MSTHHVHEQLHEATHHATGHGDSHPPKPKDFARRVAIQISVIAALLAVSEMGGKNAQNTALISNQEAANLWAFFQAKTIRMTTMVTAAELLEAERSPAADAKADAKKVQDQIAKWKGAAARYQSEPDTGEGRKELAARAKAAEKKRDDSLSAYHQFEYGSAAFQLSIVLASAAVVTGVAMLAHISLGLGVVGLAFTALGTFAPNLLHF